MIVNEISVTFRLCSRTATELRTSLQLFSIENFPGCVVFTLKKNSNFSERKYHLRATVVATATATTTVATAAAALAAIVYLASHTLRIATTQIFLDTTPE